MTELNIDLTYLKPPKAAHELVHTGNRLKILSLQHTTLSMERKIKEPEKYMKWLSMMNMKWEKSPNWKMKSKKIIFSYRMSKKTKNSNLLFSWKQSDFLKM